MEYKYGEPDDYGDFPYLYAGQYKTEELNNILMERLPDYYPMEIVCPVEEQVLCDVSSIGIDAHLEIMNASEDRVVDRKVEDKIISRAHRLGFDKDSMICLIRRLEEYNPDQFDHSDCDFNRNTDYDWGPEELIYHEEGHREKHPYDFFSAALQLRSCILETLGIEDI